MSDELVLELREVHKYFGPAHVLRGVSLAVPRGSVQVVLGLSGRGKRHFKFLMEPLPFPRIDPGIR